MPDMTDNPYLPPALSQTDSRRGSWVCFFMAWLSGILGVGLLASAMLVGYQNAQFILQNGVRFPPYIVAATMLIIVCGIGLIFSAWHWRSQRIRAGLLTFLGSVVAFVAGPRLLLFFFLG
ncbi:MAG: hypothetical protein ACTHK7_15190 [Aureliella sp.]